MSTAHRVPALSRRFWWTVTIVPSAAVSEPDVCRRSGLSFTQTMTVPSPHLWHPYSPYLYTLYTEVYDGSRPADSQRTRIGIRSISFSKAGGFRINGRPFRFRGSGSAAGLSVCRICDGQ